MTAGTQRAAAAAARVVVGLLVALVVVWCLFALTSDDPFGAMGNLFTGAASSPGRITQWLSYSSFLMLTGASVCLAFRVGLFSIGAEGQVFIGALVAGITALAVGPSSAALPLAILASIVGGALWALLPGLMKAYLNTDEIVTTLMLNYVATFLFAFVVKQFLQPDGAGFPVSEFFDQGSWLPTFGTSPAIPSSLLLGVVACLLASVMINRTRLGYMLRMVGDSQRFAHANGMRVPLLVVTAFVLSGGVAGMAGAAITFGDTHRLILGMASGIGFDGILVALLAVNRPGLVPLTALAYGYLRTGGDVIQITSNVPRDVVVVLQGLLIIALAVALRKRANAAQAPEPDADLVARPDSPVDGPAHVDDTTVTSTLPETASTEGGRRVLGQRS